MKEISKISKSFTCDCGTVNKFEFETDFDVHDIKMSVRCQRCGKERMIELMNFFMKHPTFVKPTPSQEYQGFDILPFQQQSNLLNAIQDQAMQSRSQISNEAFSEAMPVGVFGNQNPYENYNNILNGFNGNNNENMQNKNGEYDESKERQKSVYAGLLDLQMIQDEIYEPFKENGNSEEKNNNIMIDVQNNSIQKKGIEKDDEETFSALFGNL